MSPELERLLEAYDQKLTCPSQEKLQRTATFERLLRDALSRQPNTNRDEFMLAVELRYKEFRRKTTTLPPRA